MTIIEDAFSFQGNNTHYRIVNPGASKTPLLLLHGGPGSTCNYFEVLDTLADKDDRPIVMYDQIGCGKSMVTGRPELFTADTWLAELMAIRTHLNLDSLHILGQSWGGMMAIMYAIEHRPKGVISYILSSTLSSATLWRTEQHRRIHAYMPKAMQQAIMQAEATDDYTSDAYILAITEFMKRHCAEITEHSPECVTRPKVSGEEAYIVGWGQNEFTPTGTLSDYEYTDRLHEIHTPCLITSGQQDLCSPFIAKTMQDNLPHAEWSLFANSRHMPFVEENDKYQAVLMTWLNKQDKESACSSI